MLVHVLMIGGVMVGAVSIPAFMYAIFEGERQLIALAGLLMATLMVSAAVLLKPEPFSPDYIMAMRMLAGFAATAFVFRRR